MTDRPCTPDQYETTSSGRNYTSVTLKRYCDNDHLVGDANDAEIEAAVAGLPLPDVSSECPGCRPTP